jgi:murein DD-endopeptidase MepM/ murein hydrolase activator NlpD
MTIKIAKWRKLAHGVQLNRLQLFTRRVRPFGALSLATCATALLLSAGAWAMIRSAGTMAFGGDAAAAMMNLVSPSTSFVDECNRSASLLPDWPMPPDTEATVVPLLDTIPVISETEKTHRAYRADGKTVAGPALAAPIVGAVITSPYGWRIHPILKRLRFHKGVDFGAPEGTPVRAAQGGTVEEADWHGHYGYYVRIRHSRDLETAYAHLADIDPSIKAGTTVKSGQVIASVGETGWATGPHLYYEVIVDGRRVNPLVRPAVATDRASRHAPSHPTASANG